MVIRPGPNIVPQLATISCDYRVTTLPDNDTVSPQTSDLTFVLEVS